MRAPAAIALVLATTVVAVAAGARAPAPIDTLRRHSLELVNAARREAGLRPLARDAALTGAAQAHADDMLRRHYFAHLAPDGGTLLGRYAAALGHGPGAVAENIARCRNCTVPADAAAVESLQADWLASPEHRRNILDGGMTRYGFGLAEDADGTRYAVQAFAGPGR
jgi:uncharacterized protein YkwD